MGDSEAGTRVNGRSTRRRVSILRAVASARNRRPSTVVPTAPSQPAHPAAARHLTAATGHTRTAEPSTMGGAA
eukprot:scaffold53_cov362-Prasinococcus_capsulatus_cf.AAC.12